MIPPALTAQTAANLQAIHPDIPPAKLESMVGRTIFGGLLALPGVLLLLGGPGVAFWLLLTHQQVSVVTYIALGAAMLVGLLLVIIGALTISTQLAATPIKTAFALVGGLVRMILRRAPSAEG